jgi:plastocyanin
MKRMTLVVSVLACGLVAAGIATGATTLRVSADSHNALKYNKKTLTAKAGKVTIVMANPSVLPHNVAIKGSGANAKGPIVGKGKTSSVTATLKEGRYTFYCSVPGHEAAGMKGTLVVT